MCNLFRVLATLLFIMFHFFYLFQVASVYQQNKDTIANVYRTMLEDIVALKSIHVEILYAIMEAAVW